MLPRDPTDDDKWRWPTRIAVVAALALAVVFAVRAWMHAPGGPPPLLPGGDATAPTGSEEAVAPPKPPRCTDVSPEPFVIGDAPPPKPAVVDDAGAQDDDLDQLAPFAVEVGRGATYPGGFAVGALRDAEGGTVAFVATLGADGRGGKLVRLGRSRGDLNPPVVAEAGGALLAVMMEPNASGRAIRVAKVVGDAVTWGPEVSEGRDESLAVDLASSGDRAVLVWDDLPGDGKVSNVMLSTFDVATMKSATKPRPVSPPKLDAEEPRIVARPGGYWLAYAVRAEAPPAKDAKGASKEKPAAKKDDDDPDEDTRAAGEKIGKRWVEVVPLDEAGAPAGSPRAVTSKDSNVLAFDLDLGAEGAALIAFRDDDTPSGSSGGRLATILVRLGGPGEPHVVADENLGSGAPDLLPGWIAVSDVSGATRLAGVTPTGEATGPLDPEPSLRGGELLAATKDALLIARPAGKSMRLSVSRCAADTPDGGP